VNVLPGSCSGMCVSPCDDACEVISKKAEPGTGIEIKVEENPEPISFPEIKAEPDEVSYMSVCHQYTKIDNCLVVSFILVCPHEKPQCGERKFVPHLGFSEFLVTECVCK